MICGESSMLICSVSSRGRIDLVRRSAILGIVTIVLNISLNHSLTRTFCFSCLFNSFYKICQILIIFWSFQDKSDLSIYRTLNNGYDSMSIGSICCERTYISSVLQYTLDILICSIGIYCDVL